MSEDQQVQPVWRLRGCLALVAAVLAVVVAVVLLVILLVFAPAALGWFVLVGLAGLQIFLLIPGGDVPLRARLWHSPFLIVLAAQTVAGLVALAVWNSWWPDPEWTPRADCVLAANRTQVHELGRTGSVTYQCPTDELLPMVYSGLLCLAALPFLAISGPTRRAAVMATLLGLLPVAFSALWLTAGEVSVTVDYPIFGSPNASLGTYPIVILVCWALTALVYGAFWAWISQPSHSSPAPPGPEP